MLRSHLPIIWATYNSLISCSSTEVSSNTYQRQKGARWDMRDFGLPQRRRWDLRSSGILRSVEWPADWTNTYSWRWNRQAFPKRRYGITTVYCVISQNSADLRIGNICTTYQKPIWIFTVLSVPIGPYHLFHCCHRFCSTPLFWCGFWWPRALRRRSADARLLGNGCVLWELCVVRERSLWRADPSSRGILPNVCVCVIECDQMQQ